MIKFFSLVLVTNLWRPVRKLKENLRVDMGDDNLTCTQSEIFFSASSWADQNLFKVYFDLAAFAE